MKPRIYLFLITVIVLLFNSCQQGERNLKIIVSTDVHGSFFPSNINSGEEIPISLARVQSLVNAERSVPGQEVVLLDNGDIIQGDPVVYYSNFEKTEEANICAQIMNFMKYDAATIGNHDIEAGHDVYDKLIEESNFPWMAANAVRTDNEEPYFVPYTIIERKGVSIAVLGLITPAIPSWLPPEIWSGMKFEDMLESARYWVKHIKSQEQPDLLIGLFHAGMDYTYNNQTAETFKNENAVQLVAEQVDGFDIIFCGHDHNTWNKKVKGPDGGEVLILGSRSKAREVAIANLSLSKKDGAWEITNLTGINQDIGDQPPDELYMKEFASMQSEVEEYVLRELGSIDKTISSRDAYFGPSAFIDLIHQVQLDISGADISFAAPLSHDTKISKGEILVGDMFQLYRYENLLYTIKLSGQEILDYLNFSYKGWFNSMKSTSDHLILFTEDDQGRLRTSRAYYNFDSAMGIKYVVDVSKPAGKMVDILSLANGESFNPEEKYLVAVNSYRGNGGGGHLTDGAGLSHEELSARLVKSTTKDLRFYMMRWIENKKAISPVPSDHWKVIPEELARAGRENDYPILFRN